MYIITQSQWEKIPDDYKGESIDNTGDKVCFLSFLTPDGTGGSTLCREYLHFVIIPDEWEKETQEEFEAHRDKHRDAQTLALLQVLTELTDAERDDWRRRCLEHYKDNAEMKRFITLEYNEAERYAHQERGGII